MRLVTLKNGLGVRVVVNADTITRMEENLGLTRIYFDHSISAGERQVTACIDVQGTLAATTLVIAAAPAN